jgi:hypothetical protein
VGEGALGAVPPFFESNIFALLVGTPTAAHSRDR